MIKNILATLNGPEKYKLVDENHSLDIYAGYNNKGEKTLLLDTTLKIDKLKNTKHIKVDVRNENNRFQIFLSLEDNTFEEQFYVFCDDIIEYSSKESDELIASRLYLQRFLMWKNLFGASKNKTMSFENIKGLYGELIFLKEVIIERYGKNAAVKSWLGPLKNKRDFEVENTWYEVKTTTSDSKEVYISSISQLDDPTIGFLVAVKLEQSNLNNIFSKSLYKLVEELLDIFEDFPLKEEFINKLDKYGYDFNEVYENYIFHYIGVCEIEINENSKVIRRSSVPISVSEVSYKINYELIN